MKSDEVSDEADEVIKKLFDSLKNRYQSNLESMKGSDCPDWIKNEKRNNKSYQ